MNEETTIPTEEVSDPGTQPATAPDETEAAATGDGTVTEEDNEISETVADIPSEEPVLEDLPESTEETISLTVQETIELVGSDICHVSLFGSFLICGTLIGLALLRKVYGT